MDDRSHDRGSSGEQDVEAHVLRPDERNVPTGAAALTDDAELLRTMREIIAAALG